MKNGEAPARKFGAASKVLLVLGLIMQTAGMLALGLGTKLTALVFFLIGLVLVAACVVAFFLGKLLRVHNVKLP